LPDGFHLTHFSPLPYVRWLGSASNATADRRWPAQTPISVKAAAAVWRHFVQLMEALPADQAAPLWQVAQAHAMKALESGMPQPVCAAVV
jgi:hypothetical protein